MTVEEIRGDRDNYDNFPVGLRVLAVDDDPICLKLLETLLRKCQYHVTTTKEARVALKMLRDDRDRFDLVISDVHMPDMDGFKLLEQVGLEMDLPVIMLSANGDPKLVMKGVTHGACDYLVKPVRIEELQNIWQHVLRKKKPSSKNHSKSNDQVKSSGDANGSPTSGNGDQSGKYSRKRKDEDYESEDNGNDSEDPGTQKKPRVVWSIELHRKFVGAVNQLGIEKAVPKRILDMMNVEGLTRENVASHLQKYRLYLKRISSAASQQANMAAALGIKDSFMRMGSLDGLGDYRSLGGAGRLGNTALSPYTSGVMLGRLNSSSNININIRNLTPPLLAQPNHSQNLNLHPALSPVGQSPNLFQGIQSSLDDSRVFSPFSDQASAIGGSSSNLLSGTTNNHLMNSGGFGNQSFNSEQNVSVMSSSNLIDPGNVELSKMQPPNSLLYTEPFHAQLPIRENNCSNGPYIQNNSMGFSSSNVALGPLEDSNEHSINMNQTTSQRWGEHRQNFVHGSSNNYGSVNSHIQGNDITSPLNRSLDQNGGGIFNQKMDMFVNGRSGGGASNLMQQNGNEKLGIESRTRSNDNFLMEQPKLQGGFVPQSYDSLDDLVSAMIKREQDVVTPNCDFGFDDYTFGAGV